MASAPSGWEDYQRKTRVPPDQDQRLHRDVYSDRPSRRARPWVLVAIGVVLVGIFLAIVIAGPDDEPTGPIGAPAAAAVA